MKTAFITGCYGVNIFFYIENKKSYNYLKKKCILFAPLCTITESNLYFANSLAAVVADQTSADSSHSKLQLLCLLSLLRSFQRLCLSTRPCVTFR